MTPEQEREEARMALGELRVNEWYADKSSILIDGIPFLFSYAASHKSVTKVVELMKSHFNSLDREEQLVAKLDNVHAWREKAAKEASQLRDKAAEQDKELQWYKAALEEIAQGGDKDYVGNVLTLTSSECRTIARKALNQS